MAIVVEGIGGTGKAVVNILYFLRRLANTLGGEAPELILSITDQDTSGVFPDVPLHRPANFEGAVCQHIPLTNSIERTVSRALFDPTEIDLDVSRGFYGNPKIAATAIGDAPLPNIVGSDTVVVVFSEIGGTGAGYGPRRVAALLRDASKARIVALVFGKYLSTGTGMPVAFEWMQKNGVLKPREHRWFDCYRINVPTLAVAGVAPASGINATPALLLGAMFAWRLGLALDKGTVETFLRTNARPDTRELFADVNFESDRERFWVGENRERDFVADVRTAAEHQRLNVLIPRGEEYKNAAVRELIGSSELTRLAWQACGAKQPMGTKPSVFVDYDTAFDATFAPVPDRWAAADWFHYAVLANPEGIQASRFRRLIHLYLSGRIRPVATGWVPFEGGEEIYALVTDVLDIHAGDIALRFPALTVGFFTRGRPFWTTHDVVSNLDRMTLSSDAFSVDLIVTQGSSFASALPSDGRAILGSLDRIPCTVQMERLLQQNLSEWSWSLRLTARGWESFTETVRQHPILGANLEILEGGFDIGAANGYSCDVRGVNFVHMPLLGFDHIRIGRDRGVQYYEIGVAAETLPAAGEIRRVLNVSLEHPEPLFVGDGALSVLCGNVELTITEV
ncbi:MAG TPA: hypothetical protein VGQ65_20630 [Thermoanaerobaculia bacterium]|nr:hypothetical protein [Thermoanaerobaculia bacterium]